jgi:polar amino acid transport system substrate-binding protein
VAPTLTSPVFAALAAAVLAVCAPTPAARADDLDRVKEAGVLRWGCDAEGGAPYVYKDADSLDVYIGFEVEIAEAIAQHLGVRAERVQNSWDALLPGLKRGDYDIALNGLEMTPENQEVALFSNAYYVSSLEVTIRKGEGPIPTTLQSLRGKNVGTLKASLAERMMKAADGIDVSGYLSQVDPYGDLRRKRLDAVVMDYPIARYYGRSDDVEFSFAEFGEARYGVAVRLGENRLAAAISEAIAALARAGRLRTIYESYGIWNGATAELLRDDKIARTDPVMLRKFEHATAPLGLGGRMKRYLERSRELVFFALVSLLLSVCSMALAILVGVSLALIRVYGPSPFRQLAVFYIEAVRGTPLLIQLWIIFYALPDLGINLPKFPAAVLGLGLNYAAYEAENYRAGLTSIPLGQSEASHALGLSQLQTIRYVIVPQALRIVIPPVTNDFIALLKDSSIVSLLGMKELTGAYQELSSATGDRIGFGIVTGILYFLLGLPFARIAAKLEEKAGEGRRLQGHR